MNCDLLLSSLVKGRYINTPKYEHYHIAVVIHVQMNFGRHWHAS